MKFYVKKRRVPIINIVSMIDILVILLIFFIVTATFKKLQPQVAIELPPSKQGVNRPAENDPAIITVTASEEIFLDAVPIALDVLGAKVKEIQEQAPERAMAMKADKKTSFGFIIKVLDTLKGAGVRNLPAFTQEPGAE